MRRQHLCNDLGFEFFRIGCHRFPLDRTHYRLKILLAGGDIYPDTGGYRCFAQATQRAWDSPDADKPDKRNHPAAYVSWHDALAYCAWLTVEWREAGKIGAGETVTLPSEAEWERAAAGKESPRFPWGPDWREDCANTSESGIGDTSAVGVFPLGVSRDGCLDMAGNVWEWTRSLWGKDIMKPDYKYPYSPDDSKREDLRAGDEIWRVVRGGSWFLLQVNSRCAVRFGLLLVNRFNHGGFRVVVLCSAPVV
jgi:iron(II)-dependent oxidoreductase